MAQKNLARSLKNWGDIWVENKFSSPLPQNCYLRFSYFLHMSLELNYLKTLKVLSKNPRWKLVRIRILYITPMPTIDSTNPLTRSQYTIPLQIFSQVLAL